MLPHAGGRRGSGQQTLWVLGRPSSRRGGKCSVVLDGDSIAIGESTCRILHTPGHTPGGLSLYVEGHVLTGDTLFPGGPGLTGWPLSDFPTIISSVRDRLFALPDATLVHPGHGRSTNVGSQRPLLSDWIERGW